MATALHLIRPATLIVAVALLAGCYPPVAADESFAVRWASTLSGPTDEDEIDGISAAADGSVYVTGKFEGTSTLGGVTMASAGRADIPVARFGSLGNTLWVQRFGGPGEDNFFDIVATPGGGAVATGIFAGTVAFGSITLTSAGPSDCVVASFDGAGTVRWARAFGGPGRDGCNEVGAATDGSIVTSIDTEGGWTPLGQAPLPSGGGSDTVLLRLGSSGTTSWMRAVTGPGPQRGKAIGVAPDGAVSFGGDTVGSLTAGGVPYAVPGARRDAWVTRWSAGGALMWTETWGGPGDDLVKGVVDTGASVFLVGPITGTVDVAGVGLDAGAGADLVIARFSASGAPTWVTAVSSDATLLGAELESAPDGGVLLGNHVDGTMSFGQAGGAPAQPLDVADGGSSWFAHYDPEGHVVFASTLPGTADGRIGEITRSGSRVYLDVTLRGPANTVDGQPIAVTGKDSSAWAIDLGEGSGAG